MAHRTQQTLKSSTHSLPVTQVTDCSTLGGLYADCTGTVVDSHVQRWIKWSDRILRVIKGQQRTLRVLVTGHALGGAIAQHGFYALGKAMSQSPFDYRWVEAVGLIALGAPKVGDTAWRQSFRVAMEANEKLQYADLIVRVEGGQQVCNAVRLLEPAAELRVS